MRELTVYLQKLLIQPTLSKNEARAAFEIMMHNAHKEQIAAFLAILKHRGEKANEIVGMLEAIKKTSVKVELPYPVLDIVGTGGDMADTANISTGSAILAAACGIPVVKHGSRAVSSRCGAADVLEKLGIDITMPTDQITTCLHETKIAFLYAPHYHPALLKMRSIRKRLGIPTTFNMLGPLLNPANAEYMLIGVAQEKNVELISDVVMQMQHIKSAYVYHGCGLDELTTLGVIKGYQISPGKKKELVLDPIALGFKQCQLSDLQGGDIEKNAFLLTAGLEGKHQALADAFILNAGFALHLYGMTTTLENGISRARQVLVEGRAATLLKQWSAFSLKNK